MSYNANRKKIHAAGSRHCTKCNVLKPLDNFYVRKDRPLGYESACKACQLIKRNKWRAENLQQELETDRAYYFANKPRIAAKNKKYWAKPENRLRKLKLSRVYKWKKHYKHEKLIYLAEVIYEGKKAIETVVGNRNKPRATGRNLRAPQNAR